MTATGSSQPGGGVEGGEHGGTAGHVGLHLPHAGVGLDRDAAGVERDALADQHRVRRTGVRVAVAGDDDAAAGTPSRRRRRARRRSRRRAARPGPRTVTVTCGRPGEPVDGLLGEPAGVLHVARGVDQVAGPRDRPPRTTRPASAAAVTDGVVRVGGDDGDASQPRRVRRRTCRGSGSRPAARPRRRRAPRRRRPVRRSCPAGRTSRRAPCSASVCAAADGGGDVAADVGQRARRRSRRRRRCAGGVRGSARW